MVELRHKNGPYGDGNLRMGLTLKSTKPIGGLAVMLPKICSIPECEKNVKARGWCGGHYRRWARHGSPLGGAGSRDRRPLHERFQSGYKVAPSGCWEWTSEIDGDGYGTLRHRGNIAAHRYSYGVANDLSNFGEIDHRCRNRKCVNPNHLREVTRPQNAQNQSTTRPSKSGYRGVAWHAHSKRWHVVATLQGRQHSGGYYRDVHEAGRAAIELRKELYTHNEEDRKLAS